MGEKKKQKEINILYKLFSSFKYKKRTGRYSVLVTLGAFFAAVTGWYMFDTIHAVYIILLGLILNLGASIRYNQ